QHDNHAQGDAPPENELGRDRGSLGQAATAAREAAGLADLRFGIAGLFGGPVVGGSHGDIHASVDFAAGLPGPCFAASQGGVVVDDLVGRQLEEDGVVAQEAADVDFGEVEIELVVLELVQIVAANL